MNICYDESRNVFKLDTPNSSYIMAVVDDKWLGHVYYGQRLHTTDLIWALALDQPPYTPDRNPRETVSFFDCFPSEYPVANIGDFRETCLAVRSTHNQLDCILEFCGWEIIPGKPKLDGLPATFAGEDDCCTLRITLKDASTGIEAELYYTAFSDLDVITRSVRIRNNGNEPVWLDRALSACLHMPYEDRQLMTIHGSWAREGGIQTQDISTSTQGISSNRGITSHQGQPFMALIRPGTTQEHGEVFGFNFVYSGNFLAQVQRDQFDQLRAVMGINPEGFSWKLESGEVFQTPEAVMTYSAMGIGQMTRTLHDLYRNHLIRSPYRVRPRPVLINNWEATYFDFDEDKLLHIASQAADLGIELFVLDDGWFGNRNTDSGSLGDWQVDRRKLPNGLSGLAERINAMGMRFGLWMEPEMVSVDSDLYRAHPDWTIHTYGHTPLLCRDQYVLDLSRSEVERYVWERISTTLHSANITYLKWDMNRPLANLGSSGLPTDRQDELSHRYVLALYRLQQRLMEEFPDLLLENCCSGGGRFDPGMLFYSPQIWCSDDTDAIERLRIQEGMAMLYPLSTIGAHVSDCPNHAVGRQTPFSTRASVAMMGTFGYELDVTKIDPSEQAQIPSQVRLYHQRCDLIQTGDYFRLSNAQVGNQINGQMIVSKDKRQALVLLVQVLNSPNQRPTRVRLQGLSPDAIYVDQETGRSFSGEVLLRVGLPVELVGGDFQAKIIHFTAEKN